MQGLNVFIKLSFVIPHATIQLIASEEGLIMSCYRHLFHSFYILQPLHYLKVWLFRMNSFSFRHGKMTCPMTLLKQTEGQMY